jgi:hypothetical protein
MRSVVLKNITNFLPDDYDSLYFLLLGTFFINYKKLFNYNSTLYMYYYRHYLSYVSITNCTVVLRIIVL